MMNIIFDRLVGPQISSRHLLMLNWLGKTSQQDGESSILFAVYVQVVFKAWMVFGVIGLDWQFGFVVLMIVTYPVSHIIEYHSSIICIADSFLRIKLRPWTMIQLFQREPLDGLDHCHMEVLEDKVMCIHTILTDLWMNIIIIYMYLGP